MNNFIKDLKYAFRMMLKHRSFTFVAVFAIALGIGANTAIFSVVNGVLLRPLPYASPKELTTILHGSSPVAPANFLDLRQESQTFESIAAAQLWGPSLTGRDQPEHLRALQLSANMFHLLGINPALGRAFNAQEDQTGNDHVVVLSNRLWQRRFEADPKIIGQQLMLDGANYEVIGVMPPQFEFAPFWATQTELWVPLNLAARANDRKGSSLRIFGRLKPGISREQAQAEVATIFSRLEQQYPEANKGLTLNVDSLHEKAVGKTRPALLLLLGAVGFVLLIACANVANLLMTRATARKKEIALRIALGASRARIARQLLTESVVLALLGGGLGLLFGILGLRLLLGLGPENLPRIQTIGIDGYVLGFTLLLSLLTGLLFGLAPVLQIRKVSFNAALKEGGRGSTDGGRRSLGRRSLVISEVALALMLLVGSGLLVRSFLRLVSVDPGFDPHNVLTMTISLAGSEHKTGPQRAAFFDELNERVHSLPGVESVSAINHLPLAGDLWTLGFTIEGRPALLPGEKQGAAYRIVRPDYFQTMGATMLHGRDFSARDNEQSPAVVIVNESLARRVWPNETPIGKRITVANDGLREIVGVVKDVKQSEWSADANPEVYLPHLQVPSPRGMTLVVRSSSDPLALVGAIKNAVWAIDKNLPVSEVRAMDDVVSDAIGPQRFNTILLGLFSAIALLLAVVGIYGVLSDAVTARTHEIGVRMALGARSADVLRMVVGQGMALVGIGIVVGLFGAYLLTQLMSTLLYEVSATDRATFISIPVVVAAVAFAACLVPARRATKVDPLVALRYE
ncbi:MAG TPA: ABC transporter permease [Pyrinomonadaceae bacterium]|nr:ABC transporter permease [Pyrinomonadaceae bacterium]